MEGGKRAVDVMATARKERRRGRGEGEGTRGTKVIDTPDGVSVQGRS